jgi:hypothetical protein
LKYYSTGCYLFKSCPVLFFRHLVSVLGSGLSVNPVLFCIRRCIQKHCAIFQSWLSYIRVLSCPAIFICSCYSVLSKVAYQFHISMAGGRGGRGRFVIVSPHKTLPVQCAASQAPTSFSQPNYNCHYLIYTKESVLSAW